MRTETVFVKLENVASRLVNSKQKKKQLTEKLSYDKESNGKVILSEPTCTSSWFWFFLQFFSAVFRTKYAGCWAGNPKFYKFRRA